MSWGNVFKQLPLLFQENHLPYTLTNSFSTISVISKEHQAINVYAQMGPEVPSEVQHRPQ